MTGTFSTATGLVALAMWPTLDAMSAMDSDTSHVKIGKALITSDKKTNKYRRDKRKAQRLARKRGRK